MKIKMMKDMVLLKEVKLEQTSPSGLVLVDDGANQRVKFGEVVSVGPDVRGVNVGERAVFAFRKGQEIGEVFEPGETSISTQERANFWALHEDEIDGLI